MAGCTCENWTLQDLSDALQNMHKDKKRIVVPMFQRGKRWDKKQEQKFVDSLIKGYPVGTMLFYERFEDGKQTYILVDGLQRGNSIKKYMANPTEFFYDDSISDEFCAKVLDIVQKDDSAFYGKVRSLLSVFIKEQKTFKNLQYFEVAQNIADEFGAGYDPKMVKQLIGVIKDFFETRQDLYDRIASTVIPVIVYTGDEDNLPDIFDRINSQGTPLDQYEVYAAAWPVNTKFAIENADIIKHVIRKYDSFEDDNFTIYGYNREEMQKQKRVNAFEYLFGLSKHLVEKYDILAFNRSYAQDAVNPLAFELVNACLNDTDKIKTLYQNLYDISDINAFEAALYKAVEFVRNAVLVITKFKGNCRNTNKLFHSKYQILSMISTTFKEMYEGTNFSVYRDTWEERKSRITRNLRLYYVYDIITNYWYEGGTQKIHNAAKPNRYLAEISGRAWMLALDAFFEKSMQREEKKSIANPRSEEYVILNCVYLKTFTAMDQLSLDKFDVEHIAPKEQMRRFIEACDGGGLPISCIANLCYLPEIVNRSKGARNFYQDKNYLKFINLKEVETKYSFTQKEDLTWMDMPYEQPEDFQVLRTCYVDFCTKRFEIIKRLFCDSLGIEYEDVPDEHVGSGEVVLPSKGQSVPKGTRLTEKCAFELADIESDALIKITSNTFITDNGKKGYIIRTSKEYTQGERKKYWFSYSKKSNADIKDAKEKYCLFACGDERTIVCLPIEMIEARLDNLRVSADESGEVYHWHIVLFKNPDGNMSWMLSLPQITEVDVNNYLLHK